MLIVFNCWSSRAELCVGRSWWVLLFTGYGHFSFDAALWDYAFYDGDYYIFNYNYYKCWPESR